MSATTTMTVYFDSDTVVEGYRARVCVCVCARVEGGDRVDTLSNCDYIALLTKRLSDLSHYAITLHVRSTENGRPKNDGAYIRPYANRKTLLSVIVEIPNTIKQ